MLERSPEMVESILGVWKAGGAYIPIDSDYPVERIMGILKDSGTRILISDSRLTASLLEGDYEGILIQMDEDLSKINNYCPANLNRKVGPGNLAYVIYTSGSTGKPKGVMIEHPGMLNHIMAKVKELHINADSVIVQNASHCFDISVWQFFVGLCCGGKTVIYPNGIAMNPRKLVSRAILDQATILEVVPSLLGAMLDYLEESKQRFKALSHMVVTGEAVKTNLVKRWFEICPGIPMVNAYGPTEASDDITHYMMDKYPGDMNIPIGKPLPNLNIYIVDPTMHLCPVGVKGEIVVSGVGVGRGYLNDEAKTGKAFMDDPFVGPPGRRL